MVVESCPHGEFPNGTKKRSTDLEFADADVLAKYDEEARPVKKQKAVPEKTEPTGATLATAPATIGVFGTAANMDASEFSNSFQGGNRSVPLLRSRDSPNVNVCF